MTNLLLNRRHFMIGGAATAALAAGALQAHAAPKKGGVLRIGAATGSTTDSLDPAIGVDTYPILLNFGALRNCLTEIGPDGKLRSELAESWNVADSAKLWTFKIRKGVTFHDGRSLTPADIVATLNHHRGKDSKSLAKSIVAAISDIQVKGDDIVVTLSTGNADFAYLMSFYSLGVMPAGPNGAEWQKGIGTGPYMLKDFQPGVRANLTRYPNYWKPNSAYFDEVELISIRDITTRQNALTTGDVDVIERVDPRTSHLLARASGLKVREVQGPLHYTFSMNAPEAPFNDANVRRALKFGIDREAMVKTILRGHGAVGNDQPIGPTYKFFAKDLEQVVFDADKAKYHLKQSGLAELKVGLHISDAAFPGGVDAALMYREQAQKAGITVDVVREPTDGYFSNVFRKTPFFGSYWAGRPTEDWMFSQAYSSDGGINETQWKSERFDKLLAEGRLQTDDVKRAEIYRECQTMLRDDAATIVPLFANLMMAHGPKIVVPETIAANYGLDGYKCMERWWQA
ncbi:ABC transporter substrate-binding protein [Agrobacterium vitis]